MIARPEAATLEPLLEQLGLRQAAAVLPDWLDRAASQELSYADFLHGLLEEESVARANAATQKRLRQAGFPYAATIEQFDFRFRPELKRQVVLRYLDPTFVEQARTLALIGPPGLGKTMLAICVATKHIQLGATARFITAQQLANQLGRALTSAGRQRVLRPLLACDVLVLDELGYLPTLPGFGPALYELIAGRYERRPTLLTSNKSLTEWAAIVQDASLAAALVDRILHHGEGNVFNELLPPVHEAGAEGVVGDEIPAGAKLIRADQREPPVGRNAGRRRRVLCDGKIRRSLRIADRRDNELRIPGIRTPWPDVVYETGVKGVEPDDARARLLDGTPRCKTRADRRLGTGARIARRLSLRHRHATHSQACPTSSLP